MCPWYKGSAMNVCWARACEKGFIYYCVTDVGH